ncbi:hypothetical protein QUF58_00140 [Anaerolineales bacterium HSG24]|nr:hypothetical protein [Anaerolineales bacterium HSG24]
MLNPKNFIIWPLCAILAGSFYLLMSAWGYSFVGFPLDDAWIHQTYARNLAQTGQLAFVPGVPSAGSTAPLWSLLLSVGYLLGLPYLWWAYGLGLLFLALTGWTMSRLTERLFPEHGWLGLAVGLFCIFEWHMVWAATSGMETILFVWLSVWLVERYTGSAGILSAPDSQVGCLPQWNYSLSDKDFHSDGQTSKTLYFSLGLIGGLLILTRPEGAGLVGLIGLDVAYCWWSDKFPQRGGNQPIPRDWIRLAWSWGLIIGGMAILLLPYIAFHFQLTGKPFPNTFYAKQAEYGSILATYPLWWRLFGSFGEQVESVQGVFRVVFIGPQLLLLPGLVYGAWLTVTERRHNLAIIWLWWISFLLLYGFRLAVTYQHGRYQIPAIVWIVLLGLWGSSRLWGWGIRRSHSETLKISKTFRVYQRVFGQVIALSLPILLITFLLIGAQAYSRDVRFIETEMVNVAKWLDQHVEPDAVLAVHDIGAIGYFSPRPMIDLAGLITPAVIPIMRDEAALLIFMQTEQADYLVTFPSWYPHLSQQPDLLSIYRTKSPFSIEVGGDNIVVYQMLRNR